MLIIHRHIFVMLWLLLALPCFANDQTFNTLANDYFDQYYFPYNPTIATMNGIHRYDDKIENFDKTSLAKKISLLKKFESRVDALNPESLSEDVQGDRELVLNNIRS